MNDANLDPAMFKEQILDAHILEVDGELSSFGIQESFEHSLSGRALRSMLLNCFARLQKLDNIQNWPRA
jgi:hypothetical protein